MDPRPLDRAMGVLVPSSNRTVERTTERLLACFPGVSACYARIPLWTAGGREAYDYDLPAIRAAATMLEHAKVEVICWNGSRGAGMGWSVDDELCAAVTGDTGLPCVTTALVMPEILARLGATRVALVVPNTLQIAEKTAAGLAIKGVTTVAMRGLAITDNLACATPSPSTIAALVRSAVAESRPEAVLLWNTNFPGLDTVAPLEAELGIPVLDSTSIGVWAALRAMRIDPWPAAGFGRLFTLVG